MKVGGGASIDLEAVSADLAERWRDQALVLVHGGAGELDRISTALGHPPRRATSASGIESRLTDDATMGIFTMVYAGGRNAAWVEALQRRGVDAVGLCGLDGGLLRGPEKGVLRLRLEGGRQRIWRGDRTGRVESVNAELLHLLLDAGYLPVLTPPALSLSGRAMNVDADRVAAQVAAALGAETLVLLSDVPGLLRPGDGTSVVRRVEGAEISGALQLAQGRMRVKVLAAREALAAGVGRVVLADGRVPGAVARACAGDGTVFVPEPAGSPLPAAADPNPREAELALLEGLVAQPSPTGAETRAAGWLRRWCQAHGVRAWLDAAGNVEIEFLPAGGDLGRGDIYLLGHLDTVAGYWQPQRQGDRLLGRGSSDAKGPLAAFICAARRAHEAGRLRRRVLVLAAVAEEGDSAGARWLAASLPAPSFLVVGEPSGSGRIVVGYRGGLRCTLQLQRVTSHSSRPDATAAELGFRLWSRVGRMVGAWNRGRSGFDRLDAHLLEIATGSDGLQEEVRLRVGFRLPAWAPPTVVAARLRALEPGAAFHAEFAAPATTVPRHGRLATAFSRAIRERGLTPVWQQRLGGSDLNVVLPQWACPAVVYGPGESALEHGPQESISLTDFRQGIAVLTRVLGDL
ncbi:MAG: [LysW]-aminoadipate kinase [Candidatus Dormibacteria bacterium]